MPDFRKRAPVRRTDVPARSRHTEYRDDLKRDFNSRCGYTDVSDKWWGVKFQVDHFAPQNPKLGNPTKEQRFKDLASTYSNLVYACPQVNNAKRNYWVSDDPDVSFEGDVGLLDPCTHEYNDYFERTNTGRIKAKNDNPLALFIIDKLKLYLFRYELYWRIDELDERKARLHKLRNDPVTRQKYGQEINNLIADLDEEFQKYMLYIGANHNVIT